MICEVAPAKINLTLEVIKKRIDGYHEIKSVMQTIDLCDVLTFWKNPWIQIIPEYCNLPSGDSLSRLDGSNYIFDNLVYKAASILKQETGYSGGALIQLKKNIPSSAGLGGGSSDAASTLKGLNRLWGLKLSKKKLAEIGAKVGSDVPYFIYGGTCLIGGRGELVKPVNLLSTKWLVIILLPIEISQKTARIYSHVNPSHYTDGKLTRFLVESLDNGIEDSNDNGKNGKNYNGKPFYKYLYNTFEMVYSMVFNDFDNWINRLRKISKCPLHLAGSGPAVYYITDSEVEVRNLVENLEKSFNLKKYIARTVS